MPKSKLRGGKKAHQKRTNKRVEKKRMQRNQQNAKMQELLKHLQEKAEQNLSNKNEEK